MHYQFIQEILRNEVARIVKTDCTEISLSLSLSELGVDSLGFVELSSTISKKFSISLQPETLFEHNSLTETARYISSLIAEKTDLEPLSSEIEVRTETQFNSKFHNEKDVAIIGVAFRLPGGIEDIDSLWTMMKEGATQLRPLPVDRLSEDERGTDFPEYLRGGFIDSATEFDAAFFGISPREAMAMDPQQRLLLECAWHAFEDAGLSMEQTWSSNTAVFVGASSFDYYELLLRTKAARSTHIGTGVSHAILANRLSQYFNLTGPSETIDSACASSLVALWRGVELLRNGDSEMALIGGVNLLGSRSPFQFFADAGMLSPTGECRPFDESANGYVRGEGVVCVVLKPVTTAINDRNRILAIIKGGAIRHSGKTQSLTAPNPQAQADVIKAAIADAKINPESIGYIETHGTGTPLGDPIEIQGLKKAFARKNTDQDQANVLPHFMIGSIKSQIGHLEAAAGLAGLVKAIAILEHGEIPGSSYIKKINNLISMEDTPFYIPLHNSIWQEGVQDKVMFPAGPRRAGVSSFGFGGTNSHVILEQAPKRQVLLAKLNPAKHRLFIWSAKTDAVLKLIASSFDHHLAELEFGEEADELQYLDDMAFTLSRGRTALELRLAVIAVSKQELREKLQSYYASNSSSAAYVYVGKVNLTASDSPNISKDESERLQSISKENDHAGLIEIATLWTKGASLDWDLLFPRRDAVFLPLPYYPFEKKRYWVTDPVDSSVDKHACDSDLVVETYINSVAKEVELTSDFYVPRFIPAPLETTSFVRWEGDLIFLVAGPRGHQLVKKFRSLITSEISVIDGTSSEAIETLLSVPYNTAPAGLLDLTPLDETGYNQWKVPSKLSLLRHLIGDDLKRGKKIKLIHVTCGLKHFNISDDATKNKMLKFSLAGAQDTAFFAHLGAEYKNCQSKTIDFALFEPKSIAQHLLEELQHHDKNTCLIYWQEKRWTQTMMFIPVPKQAERVRSRGTALITGGTGDIGLHLAEDLANRGFKALLLTCRSKLTPNKDKQVKQLQKAGIAISIYRGVLTDVSAFTKALEDFKTAHGAITHVFHCAGTVDTSTPVFFRKTEASIAAVMSPKVDALLVLHEIFIQQPPEMFVLFSSVSAIVPRFAAGALDYSAANCFMDLFAEYQHAQGNHYYRSIQWTRWRDTGLAKHVGHVDKNGDDFSLTTAGCLNALHHILTQGKDGNPTICVLAKGDMLFAEPADLPVSTIATNELVSKKLVETILAPNKSTSYLRRGLRSLVAKELEIPESKLDEEASFEALGIDSIILIGLVTGIETWLGLTVEPHKLIDCNSISSVAQYLEQLIGENDAARDPITPPTDNLNIPLLSVTHASYSKKHISTIEDTYKVAVIGVACNFPGAPNKDIFWQNLLNGVDSVVPVPASRWNTEELYSSHMAAGRSTSRWGGFISDIEKVIPSMFSMNAADAADVDPLIRLFTECCFNAVTDSPYGLDGLRGKRVGVFAGARAGQYAERIAQPRKQSITGIGQNFVAAYTSHLLNLHGPSLVLDSACSSSLATIHLACQSLRCGDSELALAGGAEVLLDEQPYLFLSAAGALSPDGRCRPLDAKANGFVPGEGVGCVLLKPLSLALADGDPIYAVIEGSAMNNDGHTLGITTPGVSGQLDVIERALLAAQVSARDISYVEIHGTGTLIGDPIELQALAKAFQGDPPDRCGVGSVKSNVGHLLSAAGVASFIKTIMSLHHATLPPTLHVEQINPRFDFQSTPFYPVQQATNWNSPTGKLRAGISAFGFGKTNVHMIVAQSSEDTPRPFSNQAQLPILGEHIRAWHQGKNKQIVDIDDDAQLMVTDVVIEDLV